MNSGKNLDWTVKFDAGFANDLKKLGRSDQVRIKKYLDKLKAQCSDPRQRGEPLVANLSGFWRYRIGNYRLICQIIDGEIVILCLIATVHRSKSYSNKSVDELLKRVLDLEKKL